MIFGIGTDLCDVRRVARTLERHGERFAQKILGPSEFNTFLARQASAHERAVRYLATRFSAKEAISKALGTGLRPPMSWHGCEILNESSGRPCVMTHDGLTEWLAARGLVMHVSLTDEREYVAAFAVVEARPLAQAAGPSLPLVSKRG